jgi:Major Facilitator Superfamily
MSAVENEAGEACPRWAALLSGRNAVYSIILAGGVTLHALNIYIVTTILPSVVGDVGGLEFYAWSTTLFVVASILGAALSSRLLDRVGPGRAYASATALFVAGTLICAAAPALSVLLAGRFVQGLWRRASLSPGLRYHPPRLSRGAVVARLPGTGSANVSPPTPRPRARLGRACPEAARHSA